MTDIKRLNSRDAGFRAELERLLDWGRMEAGRRNYHRRPEQANLDFSQFYAEQFRKMGDEETQSLFEKRASHVVFKKEEKCKEKFDIQNKEN